VTRVETRRRGDRPTPAGPRGPPEGKEEEGTGKRILDDPSPPHPRTLDDGVFSKIGGNVRRGLRRALRWQLRWRFFLHGPAPHRIEKAGGWRRPARGAFPPSHSRRSCERTTTNHGHHRGDGWSGGGRGLHR